MAPASEREWARPVFWLVLGLLTGALLHAFFTRDKVAPPLAASVVVVTNQTARPLESWKPQPNSASALDSLRSSILSGHRIDLTGLLLQVDQFTIAECEELLSLCKDLPEYERYILSRAAARRWASVDPHGVFDSLHLRRGTENWSILAQAAASELARRDPESLVAKFDTTDKPDLYFMRRILLEELAKVNPWRAADVASVQRDFIRDNDLYQIVARNLARQSPQQGLEWAKGLWQPYARLAATHQIWETWTTEDPAAAAAEFARNPPAARARHELVRTLSSSWSRKDPKAAAAWIQTLSPREREEAWSGFRPGANSENASELLELVQSIDSEKTRRDIARGVAAQLAQEDHAKALEWTKNFPLEDQSEIVRNIAYVWARSDPRAASDYLLTLPEDESRTQAIGNVLGHWAQLDPEAALAWTAQLPSAKEREAAAGRAVGELHHHTPESAMRWVDLVEEPSRRAELAREIVSRWAQTDGAAAAQWVESSPDAQDHPGAYYAVARQWAFAEPEAAAQWMSSLPEGPNRDSAIDAYVSSMDGYDPSLATQWAATIQSPENQARATGSAFRRWMQKDAAAARAWFEQVSLPETVRADLATITQQPAHAH